MRITGDSACIDQEGTPMTAQSKRLKILCLVSLFLGIVEIVCGFVMVPPLGVSIFISLTACACGILSIVLGIHGARAANVPSKAKSLRTFAFVISLLCGAALGGALYYGHGFTSFAVICSCGFVVDVAIIVAAHQVKRALDRK